MDPTEIDTALEELEVRLERLRALYQQYFLGIEKVEPAVARKDVDRRIWQLRREQIRNTGKRFKLNVLVQRYNTFQQYWTRICREIEAGTYARHLLRAHRSRGDEELLTIAARKRLGRRCRPESAPDESPTKAADARRSLEQDLASGLAGQLDPMEDLRRAMDEALGVTARPPAAAAGKTNARIPAAPSLPQTEGGITPFDLELDEEGGSLATPKLGAPVPHRAVRESGRQEATKRAAAAPYDPDGGMVPDEPGPRASPLAQTSGAARRGARPSRPAAQALPAPRSRLSQAKAVTVPPRPTPKGRPSPIAPAPAPPVHDKVRKAGGPAGAASGLTDERLRQLHGRLLQAKRQTGETGSVSTEGLARSLRAAEAKLREKHGRGRSVDFDIVIKDGKAVVKPIVR